MKNTTTYTGKEIKNAYYQENTLSFDLMISMAGVSKESIRIQRNKTEISVNYKKCNKYLKAMNVESDGYSMEFDLPSKYDAMKMNKTYDNGALYLSFSLKGNVLIDGVPTPTPTVVPIED